MLSNIKIMLHQLLSSALKNRVYTSKNGLAAGLKRRGGFDFLPLKKDLTHEHIFLKNLNFTNKTIYDVGGHIGLITMFFAREVGNQGQVVTFEPNPQNYAAILDHVKLNHLPNVRVLPIGLGYERDTLEFVVTGSALGTASQEKQQSYTQEETRIIEIEVDNLDNQISENNLPKPDFIKIDVEGLELDVLRGMPQTINTYKPELFIELHGVKEHELVKLLLNYDYKIHQVEQEIDITLQNLERVRGHIYATPQ